MRKATTNQYLRTKFINYAVYLLLLVSLILTFLGVYQAGLFSQVIGPKPVATITNTRDFKLQMLDNKLLGSSILLEDENGTKHTFMSIEDFLTYINKNKLFENQKNELEEFRDKIEGRRTLDELDKIRAIVKNSSLHYRDSDSELLVNVYNDFINAYATPIGVILGFLAIAFVLKIEFERLDNERKHYKKQAKDNLSDFLSFSIDLMENIDRKHVDFFYTYEELQREGICINFSEFIEVDRKNEIYVTKNEYLEYKNLFSINLYAIEPELVNYFQWFRCLKKSKCLYKYLQTFIDPSQSKNLETDIERLFSKNIYISSRFIKKLYLHYDLKKVSKLLECNNKSVDPKMKLRQLYYRTLSKNFIEYQENKRKKVHTLNEEVKKIAPNIEEIIIKKDFDLNSKEHKNISEAYLKILDNIKNFENIIEGNDFIFKEVESSKILPSDTKETGKIEEYINGTFKENIKDRK